MSMNALVPVLQHQLQMLYSLPVWPIYIWHGWIGKPSLKLPIPAERACNTPILRHSLGFGAFVGPADLVIEVLVQVLRQLIRQGTWEQNNPLCLSCLNILLWFGKEAPTVSAASVTTALGNTSAVVQDLSRSHGALGGGWLPAESRRLCQLLFISLNGQIGSITVISQERVWFSPLGSCKRVFVLTWIGDKMWKASFWCLYEPAHSSVHTTVHNVAPHKGLHHRKMQNNCTVR